MKNLDLSNFNTQNVTNMENMFYGCKSLLSLNLSNFNAKSINSMNTMFYGCTSLVKQNVIIQDEKLIQQFSYCIIY